MEKISLALKNILNNYYTIKVDNKFNCNIKDSTEFELETELTINAFTDGFKSTENKTGVGYLITKASTTAPELEIISNPNL